MELWLTILNKEDFSDSEAHPVWHIRYQEGKLQVGKEIPDIDLFAIDEHRYHLLLGQRSLQIEFVDIDYEQKQVTLLVNQQKFVFEIQTATDRLLQQIGINQNTKRQADDLKAPMPGLILDIKVKEGQQVRKGDPLLILEAMKMENVLKANADAKVKAVLVSRGEGVEKNQTLITFE